MIMIMTETVNNNNNPEYLCCINCAEYSKLDQNVTPYDADVRQYDDDEFQKSKLFHEILLSVSISMKDDDDDADRDNKEEENVITVWDAISSIYNLDPVMTKKRLKMTDNNNNLTICPSCKKMLTDLYKLYVQFNQVRRATSFLAQAIQDLDIDTMAVDVSSENVTPISFSSNQTLPVELEKNDMKFRNSDDDLSSPHPTKHDVTQNSALTLPLPNSTGPWVKLVRLSPQEIVRASATTRRRRKIIIKADKVELSSDDDDIDDDDSHDDEDYVNDEPNEHELNVEFDEHDEEEDDFIIPESESKLKRKKSTSTTRLKSSVPKASQNELQMTKNDNRSRNKSKCSMCEKYFCPYDMKVHFRVHTKEKPYVCECGRSFGHSSAYHRHLRKVHGNKTDFVCDSCDKSFPNATHLKHHRRRVHLIQTPFVCKFCDRNFANPQSLKLHKKRFHQDDGGSSSSLNASQEETGSTAISRPHLCPICGTTFNFKSALESHLLFHSESRDFKCSTCDRSFKNASIRNRHQLIHTEVKSFLCTQCGKTFYQPQGLKIHMKVHTGEKPYQCKLCSLSFGYNQTLKKHIVNCHGEEYQHLAGITHGSRSRTTPAVAAAVEANIFSNFELHHQNSEQNILNG